MEQPQHLVRLPGQQQQHEQQSTSIQFGGPEQILTMTGKSADRHWKTTDYKKSVQLKKLENEQAELLKTFDGHLADVKIHLAQKKPVPAERTYQGFFEAHDDCTKNRQQQR